MRWRDPFPAEFPSAPTVIIGNFDGVHRGHHYLLNRARAVGAPLVALTFEPHPRTVLNPASAPFRLTSHAAKRQGLLDAGADLVFTLDFNAELAAMSAEAFVDRILVGTIGARTVVIGEDYRFGQGRKGDRHLLRRLGTAAGFDVLALPAAMDGEGHRFSSSLVRERIAHGRLDEAAYLLGRRWAIAGTARPIQGGAVAVGFDSHVRPAAGYYAVEVRRNGSAAGDGIAFVGAGADCLVLLGEQQAGAIEVSFGRRLDAGDQAISLGRIENFSACL